MIFITLLALLGCATTVLVAWVSAGVSEIWFRGDPVVSWSVQSNDTGARLTTTGWIRWSYDFGVASTHTGIEPGEAGVLVVDLDPTPLRPEDLPFLDGARVPCEGDEAVNQMTHGWPMRSMRAVERWRYTSGSDTGPSEPIPTTWGLDQGIPIVQVSLGLLERSPVWPAERQLLHLGPFTLAQGVVAQLPLAPIASGFLVDAAAFAGAWGVLFVSPSALRGLRRWRRLRRSRCAWCGHQLGAGSSARCPECGRTRPARAPQPSRRVFALTSVVLSLVLLADGVMASLLHLHARSFERPLESALRRGTVAEVIAEIDRIRFEAAGRDCSYGWCEEATALTLAARLDRLDLVKAMIAHGIDPVGSLYGSDDPHPLEEAIRGRARSTIDELVRTLQTLATSGDAANGAAVALCGALRVAAEESDAETIERILADSPAARGEEWWCFPDTSGSLLFHAARSPDPRVLETLLAWYRRCSDSEGRIQGRSLATIVERSRAMPEAVRWRRQAPLAMLLETGAEIEPERPASATVAAVLSGDLTMLRRVLDAGAAPDADDTPTITIALAFRQPDMARMLVAAGADPNRDHPLLGPPLCAAASLELPREYLRLLIELGADDRGCPGRGEMSVE